MILRTDARFECSYRAAQFKHRIPTTQPQRPVVVASLPAHNADTSITLSTQLNYPSIASVGQPGRSKAPNLSIRAAAAGAQSSVTQSPQQKILHLLAKGYNNYNPGPELPAAVEDLIASSNDAAPANTSMVLGQGVWEVFYAPHIAGMSSVMGTRFEPIRYTLQGESLLSHVRYSNPLLGQGWLSAAGTMKPKDDATLLLSFDRFWVDLGPDSLRQDVGDDDAAATTADSIIGAMGRAAFIQDIALFPVLYVDDQLAVFKFPPLNSNIAVRKVNPLELPAASSTSS